ncbi:unnamed protein product [Sphenostylis stenocarpa]|uniref:Uncharacterized protein n=1 Tax=Sphenostylis stenocarpa TaxID=92480 RepID=A0AA86VW69_9FABA|nr:unnamed protein product [Sphenostylis stenocarpa]
MEKGRIVLKIGNGKKWNMIPPAAYWRSATSKASNRAAVHGVKPPVSHVIEKEELEKEIQKAKEEKEAQKKQIEKNVESHINDCSKPDSSSAL